MWCYLLKKSKFGAFNLKLSRDYVQGWFSEYAFSCEFEKVGFHWNYSQQWLFIYVFLCKFKKVESHLNFHNGDFMICLFMWLS